MDSDMDLILDMMPEDNVVYNVMEEGKSNEYYQGQAEHILKNIDTDEYYLSNIIINNNLNNKNNSSSAIYTNYKFSNIQQLRRIIRINSA